ncbi:MAG: glycosyltransferase involved in cell wall biosynthesis [Flavobacteriaceae bacterium]|jgi:glycosyltransferase involved in cell wall biosynthesis
MVLLYLFAIVVLINCCYFLLFSKFSFLPDPQEINKDNFPVSLIICAKNEADNLKENIPLWLNQKYSDYEIILINDASYDDTLEIMESFESEDSRIKIVNVENIETFWGSKKYALTLGIKKAKHQRMVFSDADCKPASPYWLQEMAANFTINKQVVLGYGAYNKIPGLLNKLIRFETFMTALQYFSYAKAGFPYMGVGRNLGYTSEIYYDNSGFVSHMEVQSGDDDLFVNQVATKSNTAICYSKESFTYSKPKLSWKKWIKQKKRHISTAKYYKLKHRFLLGSYFIFQVLFWVLSLFTFIFLDWKIPLALIIFRLLIQFIVLHKAMKKLNEKDLIYWFPFLELVLITFQFSIFISNSSSKTGSWK